MSGKWMPMWIWAALFISAPTLWMLLIILRFAEEIAVTMISIVLVASAFALMDAALESSVTLRPDATSILSTPPARSLRLDEMKGD